MTRPDFISVGRTSQTLGDAAADGLLALVGEQSERTKLAQKTDKLGISTDLAIEHARVWAARLGVTGPNLEAAIHRGKSAIAIGAQLCESPIEKHVLPWLVFANYEALQTFPALVHNPRTDTFPPNIPVMIVPQFAFVKFRVDFALFGRWKGQTKIIAVECDGSAFHGAERDRKRDAYLRAWGIETVRAMGSEIKTDPRSLTRRAANLLTDWAVQL